ncbi:MAG: PKD domain-containing protein [Gammaproteobacteria bacterium]|nr:PKD domain-containing protein [Gammaproteobacteria bacterium]
MKYRSLTFVLSLCALSSHASAETWIGCQGYSQDANKLYIYSGPSAPTRVLVGEAANFKAKAPVLENNGSGGSNTWMLLRDPTWSGNWVETYRKDGSFDLLGKDDKNLYPTDSGRHAAVIIAGSDNSNGGIPYCNNRMFYAQKRPTVSGYTPAAAQDYVVYNTPTSFFGSGWIDTFALNHTLAYTWNFDDGTQSQEQSPVHAFANAGEYYVTVKSFDGTFYSDETNAAQLWVRGPAQPPRRVRYEFGNCNYRTRTGYVDWEKSGTSFEMEVLTGSVWMKVYSGAEPMAPFSTATTGSRSIRVRAFDPQYGGPSTWRNLTINVPSCSGGGGDVLAL